MIKRIQPERFLNSKSLRFSIVTYIAIALNGLSGVFLARSIGAAQRGVLAYYANFLLMTSFISASNISNATARTFVKRAVGTTKNPKFKANRILVLGFFMSFISAFMVSEVMINDWELNKFYFMILMVSNGFAAYSSLYDGYWRYSNSIATLTWTRFVGLATPSVLTLGLIAIGRAEIRYLLLGQILVTILNLQNIVRFKKKYPITHFPNSGDILRSALNGFPTYLAEYLVSWIIPFLILRMEGSEVLGWYVVALSYALLADVAYTAIESKNYRSMLTNHIDGTSPEVRVFLKNSLPILLMHLIFMPLVVLIPRIYGSDFKTSSLFAIVILIVRIPLVLARSMTSFLISLSKNFETLLIFVSFLVTFILVMLKTDIQLLTFHWIPAYAIAASVMLLVSFLSVWRLRL